MLTPMNTSVMSESKEFYPLNVRENHITNERLILYMQLAQRMRFYKTVIPQ